MRRRSLIGAWPAALAGCATPPREAPVPQAGAAPFGHLHLLRQDWHADVVLPVAWLDATLAPLAGFLPGAAYLGFGFGQRAFLMSDNQDLGPMLLAMAPSAGAMMLDGFADSPDRLFPPEAVVTLPLTLAGLVALQRYLAACFAWDAEGVPQRLVRPAGGRRVYFASPVTYSGGFTCNTWAAQAVAAAGLPVSPLGVAFVWQVMQRARAAAAA